MSYQVRLLRGLREPNIVSYQLGQAEKVEGLWRKIVLLFLACGIIYGISAYLGIGNEILSRELGERDWETRKFLFAIGQVSWGLFAATLIIMIPAVFFWTLSDIEWKKIFYLQLLVLLIELIEKTIQIPMSIFLGLPKISSIFSLGIIGQYATTHKFVHYFLAEINLFQVWIMVIQYKYIKALSEKSATFVMIMVVSLNLLFIIISAFFHLANFGKLI